MDLEKIIKNIPDYPKPGINFKDITPLMADGEAYHYITDVIAKYAQEVGADVIVGPEARGFITGCPVATQLKMGFVPVRKPGKLPREVISVDYDLEYGQDTLTMHKGDLKPGQKVLIVDDLLATGGTMSATIKLCEQSGAKVVGLAFIIEILELNGRELIGDDYNILSLVKY